MSDELKPNVGEMYLYDVMTPPLPAGSYRLDASTAVTIGADPQDLSGGSGYFDVVGPRFTLPASEVGGVFPPHTAEAVDSACLINGL